MRFLRAGCTIHCMSRCRTTARLIFFVTLAGLLAISSLADGPSQTALAAFDAYVQSVESRLTAQHQSPDRFLSAVPANSLLATQFVIEQINPANGSALPGALLHHWRGTAFVPGATAAQLDHLFRNFSAYPRIYAPQVERARILSGQGDHLQASMRVRQHHVLTVILDTTYDVTFAQLDPRHRFSLSRSTRISEISSPGTPSEHALSSTEDHGFLWRLNTYWTYEERDGGLYLQIESISLTRSIPTGLGWAIGPFVQSIPRESLTFTLQSTCNALKRTQP